MLGRYDEHALNDDDDDSGSGQKRYLDYARDIFKPKEKEKDGNVDRKNCTIVIENCDRDNKYHCYRRTILVDYKDTSKRLKNRIVV